jgi:hypothetical protein
MNLIMIDDLLNVLLNSVCKYFTEDSSIYVHQGNGLSFLFLLCPYWVFISR